MHMELATIQMVAILFKLLYVTIMFWWLIN